MAFTEYYGDSFPPSGHGMHENQSAVPSFDPSFSLHFVSCWRRSPRFTASVFHICKSFRLTQAASFCNVSLCFYRNIYRSGGLGQTSVFSSLCLCKAHNESGAICTGFSCAFVYGPSLVLLFWKKKNKQRARDREKGQKTRETRGNKSRRMQGGGATQRLDHSHVIGQFGCSTNPRKNWACRLAMIISLVLR